MNARGRRPTKRLLAIPALLVVATLAIVIGVGATAPERADEALRLTGIPELRPDLEDGCQRGAEPTDPAPPPLLTGTGRVSSDLLQSCPARFDQRTVTYVGELVGDLLHRPGGAWVQVNDDEYALVHGPLPAHRQFAGTNSGLSVWLPDEVLDQVTGLGRPGIRGDVVAIDGTVHRTDPADGGGLTLRARHLEVLRPATAVAEPFHLARAALALGSLVLATLVGVARRRSR